MNTIHIITCALLSVFLGGCLSKTITVTSTPPGAVVRINDVEIGPTPVTTAWHGGGAYRFELRHKNYAPVCKTVRVTPRWFAYPIIDMGADFMTTKDIEDHRTLHFNLTPLPKETNQEAKLQEAKKRAQAMREAFTLKGHTSH